MLGNESDALPALAAVMGYPSLRNLSEDHLVRWEIHSLFPLPFQRHFTPIEPDDTRPGSHRQPSISATVLHRGINQHTPLNLKVSL